MLDTLLNAVLPIFAVVAVGFAMARLRVVDGGIARAINRFVFLVAVPVLLFRLIGGSSIHAFDWSVLAGYLAAELAVYGAGFLVARLGFGYSRRESLLIGMTVAFSNHVFFVLPIARLVHGEAAAVVVAAIITVDAVLVYGLTVMAMDVLSGREAGRGPLATLGRIARNPQILAIAAGLAFSLSGLPLTGGLDVFTGFVGAA
ncbi:MAG: AEC family transporter, partial [Azospirillaceae bacterium]